jgi:carbon storage regulator CsrA
METVRCRVGEQLHIGDQIAITVVDVQDQRVFLEVRAPESLVIWREDTQQDASDTEGYRHSE